MRRFNLSFGVSECSRVGEITPLMWGSVEVDPIGLVLSGQANRSGSNPNLYPDIDLTKIEKMPVYKVTGKAEDRRADGKAIAEKFGIDYNYLKSIWNDTEDIFTAKGEICEKLTDDEQLFSVHILPTADSRDYYKERYTITAWKENLLEYSAVSPLESDGISFKKIGINIPDEISCISYTLKDDLYTCEIAEDEEKKIISFFKDYINSNSDIFPFKAKEYYSENKRFGLWWYNDEGEICGSAGTKVIFYNCDNAAESDIIAAHHGLTDIITAAYIVDTDWNEPPYQTTQAVEITIEEFSESFEKVGEYNIIPFKEAERCFKNNDNVNYTREIMLDESDENKAVYLKYITDSKGYVRPVFVYGVSPNDSSAWIDAIKR